MRGNKMSCGINYNKKFCPVCGAKESRQLRSRTKYECGSSDYQQRKGTFKKGKKCIIGKK